MHSTGKVVLMHLALCAFARMNFGAEQDDSRQMTHGTRATKSCICYSTPGSWGILQCKEYVVWLDGGDQKC
jgi:hypothetical protein